MFIFLCLYLAFFCRFSGLSVQPAAGAPERSLPFWTASIISSASTGEGGDHSNQLHTSIKQMG